MSEPVESMKGAAFCESPSKVGLGYSSGGKISSAGPRRPFHALDHGAVGMALSIARLGVEVQSIIQSADLLALAQLDAFSGLLAFDAPNRSHAREWMPCLEVIALDAEGQGRS